MLFALGAASTAIDALTSLTSSKSGSLTSPGSNQDATSLFDFSGAPAAISSATTSGGASGCPQISPATMSALLAAQGQSSTGSTTQASLSPSQALQDLFSQIDANGDGAISKTEFENALGAGGTNLAQADSVFSKLDANGDGSVSLDEMTAALKGAEGKGGGHHHHHHVASADLLADTSGSGASGSTGSGGASSDPLLQALAGTTSTSVTNSDGSTTTSLTYADGSKVTMTMPAAAATNNATSSYNFIERMIQRQAKALSSATNPQLSVSA